MECLLLDSSYLPVARVGWQRAITLFFEKKVEIVEEHDAYVRSVTLEMKVPAVVRFLNRVRNKKHAIKFSRENIYARDRGRCQYCGVQVKRNEYSYDHVIPRTQGGKTEWANIVACCTACNQKKGGRTPAQAKMSLLSVPVKPKKLPKSLKFCLTWAPGMPGCWKNWLRDVQYWGSELDHDDD